MIDTKKLMLFIFLLFMYMHFSFSQELPKNARVVKVANDKFNYKESVSTSYGKDLKVIFSDREKNTFYKSSYAQEKINKKDFLTPLYVINEDANSFEVVQYAPDKIGKPKGLFSFFYKGNDTFKNAKEVAYIGWIPKRNVLEYNHSLLAPSNNKPLKYKIGIKNVDHLFDIKNYIEGDSVSVFKDPFLKISTGKKLVSNQIVYPYKYNHTKKIVLVSDAPFIAKDTATQIIGWIKADLIVPIGQNKVYLLKNNPPLVTFNGKDTLSVSKRDVFSTFLYADKNLNPNHFIAPINVWNHHKNKLINIKGESLYTKEIKLIQEESKVVNLNFISDIDNVASLKTILNSLQNLYISLFQNPGEIKYYFSAILINKKGQKIYKKTASFAKWIDFIEAYIHGNKMTFEKNSGKKMKISDAINYSLDHFTEKEKRFENNLFIISSSKENIKDLGQQKRSFFKKIAAKSPKVIFVQLENKIDIRFQNYILGSKEFLYKTSNAYNEFIKNFVIDNKVFIGKNSLKNIASVADNIYVYEAPEKSLFNGAIVFPKVGKSLAPLSLEIALDSVLKRTRTTNQKILTSLQYFEEKLGLLRSEPNDITEKIYKNHDTDTLNVQDFSRNNFNEVVYQKVIPVNDTLLQSGYLLSKEEVLNLIDDYRNTFPYFASNIARKQRRIIRKRAFNQVSILNKMALRKALTAKATLADLFYFKAGIPLHHQAYHCLKIAKLPAYKKGFEKFYIQQYKKINTLEELFLNDKLQKITEGFRKDIYFIPTHLLL